MFCHWRRKVFNVGGGGGLSIDRIIGGGGGAEGGGWYQFLTGIYNDMNNDTTIFNNLS